MPSKTVQFLLLAALMAGAHGCSKVVTTERTLQMGERAQVGPVIYTVLETEWKTQLEDSLQPRIPKQKFFVVRITITNSGNQEVAIPLLTVQDDKGESHIELSDGAGVAEWLGLLRLLGPAETMQGRLLFDVPVGEYKLRLSDGGEPERERTALVHLPLRIIEQAPITAPVSPAPGR